MSNVYTVSQVNNYIKNMFTQDFMLNRIAVQGEVSNCKYHSSGHLYFSLKDGGGAIACVMFAGQRKGLAFSMKNGDRVVVTDLPGIQEWLGANAPGADVRYVPLPRMENTDEPVAEDLPAFEERLAKALEESIHSSTGTKADVSGISWEGISRRVLAEQ